MNHTEREIEEVDRLVRHLTSAAAPAAESTAARHGEQRPTSRWTNVTVRMPSRRRGPGIGTRIAREYEAILDKTEPWLERACAYVLDVRRRFIRVPSSTTLVRLWVTLAAAYGGALFFWPYPKTYFWGLVLYQACLGLSLVAGIWGARLSWDARLGSAHTLALGTVLWAMTLGTSNTMTVLRGSSSHEMSTFAYATFSPQARPAEPDKAPAKANRTRG